MHLLKDRLDKATLEQLKAQAAQLKEEAAKREAEQRRIEELARLEEQKRRENDFEYLLNNSNLDWRKYK
jgi:hypothetical protein